MCGRYTLSSPADLVADLFDLDEEIELSPRFNIAPTQEAAVVRASGETAKRRLDHLRWGLVPAWAKDPATGNRMINARAEGVAEKPSFRSSFKRQRCLVVADGFYEWQRRPGGKRPYYFHLKDRQPFGFAGLWERWTKDERDPLETFTIITTEPNDLVASVHQRMPVILRPEDYRQWLDPIFSERKTLQSLLRSYPSVEMEAFAVNTWVNSPAHDDPSCVTPA